jgi:hypothetical protein
LLLSNTPPASRRSRHVDDQCDDHPVVSCGARVREARLGGTELCCASSCVNWREGSVMEYLTDEAFGWLMSLILVIANFVAWLIDLFHEEK